MTDRKRVYISGPISSMHPQRAAFNFDLGVKQVSLLGYAPVNPHCISGQPFEYNEFMKLDLMMLAMCDGIYMLDGWETSPGAIVEIELAEKMGKFVLYQKEEMEKPDAE